MRQWFRWFASDRSQSLPQRKVRKARKSRIGQMETLEARAMMAGLIYEESLDYLGAFKVPEGNIGSSTFEYGGTALAFNPANNSLFMVGHDWDQNIAEISIPELRTGSLANLTTAGVRQSFTSVLDRVPNQTLNDGVKVGGLMVDGNRLIGSAYEFYDADYSAVDSHFTLSSLNLGSAQVGGMYQVGNMGGGFVGGYMGQVPLEWQDEIGAPYLTGQAALSIIGRTSAGPAAFGFDPDNLGSSTAPVTNLVNYPLDHPLAPESTQNPLFNTTTEITGVVFPEGTDSVLFIGSHGTGPWWYGEPDEGGYDPYRSDKGPHAPEYVYQVWAYDVHDLLAVKSGLKQAWEIKPYDVWDFDLPYPEGGKHIGGVAYDSASGKLYVSQEYGNGGYPVVHAFQVSEPTTSSSIPAPSPDRNNAPTSVKLANVVTSLPEMVSLVTNFRVADIVVADDGLGTNTLSLSGLNQGLFVISGKSLYLKAGVQLDYEASPARYVTVHASDSSLGGGVSTGYQLSLTNVNDAPVLNNALDPRLSTIWENTTSPASTLVQSFASSGIADQDVGALQGIAVTAASNMHGIWEYTLNGGQSWLAMGQPSASAARLLPANSLTQVRFWPKAGFDGTVKLWYHAWDRTRGSAGGTLAVAGNQGGNKTLSYTQESAALTVMPLNHAPVVSLGGTIGYTSNAAAIVLAAAATVADADGGNFAGGELRVSIEYGSDASNRLGISGPFTISQRNVLLWGNVIGTIRSDGFGTNPLTIRLTSAATADTVQKLVRSISFRTVEDPTCSLRAVGFQLTDGDGGTSRLQYKAVQVGRAR